jgi:hypothetical protein
VIIEPTRLTVIITPAACAARERPTCRRIGERVERS